MQQSRVAIVGAGPAGLVLALALERNGVESLILEKETEITQDPRGVYLAGDAVRILYSLGLSDQAHVIGHELNSVDFHRSSFTATPFHSLDMESDSLQQAVPTGILQIQPALEKVLRERVDASKLSTLQVGCEVVELKEHSDGVEVEYKDRDGVLKQLHTAWLIGADGKRGVVRKTFLEKMADIRQCNSDYRYDGTWVAANLKISLPTPETHPNFPAWDMGMSPQEVYDLFWPKGWHFCSPPGKPTASGRFGPHEARMWRHEFRQDNWDDKTMDAEKLLWEHLTPMITRNSDVLGRPFPTPTMFPRDCIEILRCRPFNFTHKLVNRWFHQRTILIGDAAHVFPPFGGQGIASGIRDAHQLAWRIALLENLDQPSDDTTKRILNAWASERTQSIKDAAQLTRANGILCNQSQPWASWLIQLLGWFIRFFQVQQSYDIQAASERNGFRGVRGGFFLAEHGGGGKLPQVYLDTIGKRQILSDGIFGQDDSPLRLLTVARANIGPNDASQTLSKLLLQADIPYGVLSSDSAAVISTSPCMPESVGSFAVPTKRKWAPTPLQGLNQKQARPGYAAEAFESRLGPNTTYAIVRADFYIFATARDLDELRVCLEKLKRML